MNLTLLKSYANAIYDIAKEKGKVEEVTSDLSFLCKLFKKNKKLIKLLSSPMIRQEEKDHILTSQIKDHIQGCTFAFLQVLIKKHSLPYFEKIHSEFIHIYNTKHGILEGLIYTATKLDSKRLKKIESIFSQQYNKQIRLKNLINKQVIAGMKVYINNTLYDYSLDTKLNQVRDRSLYSKH